MVTKAIVLGCGRVGSAMVRDLAACSDFTVMACDADTQHLQQFADLANVSTSRVDLSDSSKIAQAISDQDVVLGALPSHIGFKALRTVIEANKPYCDISFIPEDALELDEPAKQRGVTAIVDCGVAPGLSNMIAGYVVMRLDETKSVAIYVGGLPKERAWPYQYKAPFAPSDVIEEYTRPSRVVVDGEVIIKEALSEPELIDLPRVGTLEAFITDGLRSLVQTLRVPQMVEKTLRYPGHLELMRVLRATGFFSKEVVEVGGVKIQPLALTSKLLFDQWSYRQGKCQGEYEEEFTVMRVVVEGVEGGRPVKYQYDLYDEFDRETGLTSMARTTAFPATIMARMLARGEFTLKGVVPMELAAREDGVFDGMKAELHARGIELTETVVPCEG